MTQVETTTVSAFASAGLVRSIRRLVIWAAAAAVVYGIVMRGSRGGCRGGVDGTGGWIGPDGEPTLIEPMCWSLQLAPSGIAWGALIFTVLFALTRVIRHAQTEDDAHRILGRAAMVIVAVTLGSIVIGHTWFWLLPIEGWADGNGMLVFPFASIEPTLEPLSSH